MGLLTNVRLRKIRTISKSAKTEGRLRWSSTTTFILPYLLTSLCCLSLAKTIDFHGTGESARDVSFLSHRQEQRRVENGFMGVNKANQQGNFTKSYFTYLLEM